MTEALLRRDRRDPIRPGNQLKCRINCRSATVGIPGLSVPAMFGESDVVIHADDLGTVERMVEAVPEAWAQAEAIMARKEAQHVADDNRVDIDLVIGTPREEWPDDWTKSAGMFIGPTTGGEFRNLTGHDHLPLLSVEVIETLPGEVGREAALAVQYAQAMGVGGGSTAALEAQVATLTAQVKALTEAATLPAEAKSKRGR